MHVRDINIFFSINKTKSLHKIPSVFFKKSSFVLFTQFSSSSSQIQRSPNEPKKNSNSGILIQNHWLFKFTLSKLMHQL
jgi:hypothetical protein